VSVKVSCIIQELTRWSHLACNASKLQDVFCGLTVTLGY